MSLSPNWHDHIKKLERLGTYVTVDTTGGHSYDGVIHNYANTGKFGLVQLESTGHGLSERQEIDTYLVSERDIVGIAETSDARDE